MASPLRYTLVSDGSTDRALLPIINALLLSIPSLAEREIAAQWADLRGVSLSGGLAGKIAAALDRFPCDLLFVHRDAESSDRKVARHRRDEIEAAMTSHTVPHVCVVP